MLGVTQHHGPAATETEEPPGSPGKAARQSGGSGPHPRVRLPTGAHSPAGTHTPANRRPREGKDE